MGIGRDKNQSATAADLRRQAEERLCGTTVERHQPRAKQASQRLFHELEVHQIELEMQNAELQLAQAELEFSRNTYAELYDFAPIVYFVFDACGVIREVNLTGANLLGIERSLLVNQPFISFIANADGRELFSQHLKTVVQRQGMQRCEIHLTRDNGTVIHGQLQSAMVETVESKAGYILTSIVDGTVRNQLEEELKKSYDNLEVTVYERTAELARVNVQLRKEIEERKHTESQITILGFLKERLIAARSLNEKLRLITDGIVAIFGADFARIWLIGEGDLCEKGCLHAEFKAGPDSCRDRTRCLHLVASSGRYTQIDGAHRRVPFGCYKIGRIASGEDARCISNDVVNDPRIYDREWAQTLGLVSFVGFRLLSDEGAPMGVLALFSRQAISPVEESLMAGLTNYSSQVILSDRAHEALMESETKFRTIFENANDAIMLMKDHLFIDCNARTLQIFRCTRKQIIGQPAARFSPPFQPDGQDSREKALEKGNAALAGAPQTFEWKHSCLDGTPFDAEVSLNTVALGSELFVQAIVRDVSERKRLEEELHRLSTVDELTGLYNRRGFLTFSEQQLKFAERTSCSIVLLFIDLDDMKQINDSFGHQEGDTALVETAAILRRTFRKADIIGRMGGDEFAVLAIVKPHEGLKTVARLRAALDRHTTSATRSCKLSLSVGLAQFDPDNPSTLDELLATADRQMYEEKRTKRL